MTKKLLYKPIYHLLLVIVLGFLGYSHTLNAPFMFDDMQNIVGNPIIKNLDYYTAPSKARIHKGVAEYPLLINRYIGSLTFALNYKINKLDVTGYHVVNILIHLINSLLVYWFVLLIFSTLASGAEGNNHLFLRNASTIALFSSLLFVTHPIQTQAVTYIVQRFASLTTMFYLLSIVMYAKARLTNEDVNNKDHARNVSIRTLVYYLTALSAAVLAMKTKEIAFTLPAMIVVYEFLFFKEEIKIRILYLLPFILTLLIIPATHIYIIKLGGGVGEATRLATDISRLDYLLTEFRVIITYIRLIFFPVDQNVDYDYPLYHSIFNPEVFLSFISLLIICFTVIYSFWCYRKTNPLTRVIFFGTAWFFVTLSVESSIIPIIDVIFEHRMYLPSFGIFLVISGLFLMIIERYQQKWIEKAVFSSIIITALVFTGLTYSRNNVWNDKISLWQDVVNKSPEKARGYTNLGNAHITKGNLDQGIRYYKKSLVVDPSYALAYNNLGSAYRYKGLIDEAIKEFINAINIKPTADIYYNLGLAYSEKGLVDESINAFRNVINIDPSDADAHFNLGRAYGRKGFSKLANIEMRRGTMLKKLK